MAFVANAENQLGEVYSRNGQWAEAADCYKDAYRIYTLRLGEGARNTFITRTNLGIVEYKTGHSAAAVQALATVVHKGSPANIDLAYGSLATYVTRHELVVEGPLREYYLVGPQETPEMNAWRTEIGWPIFQTG